ncbi:MAG: DivIVA domain-containing protein [Erysipelotrichaceae bacterium]|nr:DivIVA domain-containing protein [Erysipelotrichaceae bacterium]
MEGQKPIFRVMKDGYDRFAVDDAVDNYLRTIESLTNSLNEIKNEFKELQEKYDTLNREHTQLSANVSASSNVKEDILRAAVKEANELIDNANENADKIVDVALENAALIIKNARRFAR